MTHTAFASMLNWKLLSGSHVFPGPAGGTCINEAALVVQRMDAIRSCDRAMARA